MTTEIAVLFERLPEDLQRLGVWIVDDEGLRLAAWRGEPGWEPICDFCGSIDDSPLVATIATEVETSRQVLVLICRTCLEPRGDA